MLSILYQIPTAIQRLFRGVVWRLEEDEKSIYLTFDDGCIPEVTPKVLDILSEYGVKATFFCVGDNIRKYPEVFSRIVSEGHSVGNHTFHHLAGWQTPTDKYLADVALADEYIDKNLPDGMRNKHLFRPPYGRMRLLQKHTIRQNHRVVLWDVLTHDYNRHYSVEKIMRIIKRYSRKGSIVVFHDSLKSADRMLPALPRVIEYYQSQGYQLKTL